MAKYQQTWTESWARSQLNFLSCKYGSEALWRSIETNREENDGNLVPPASPRNDRDQYLLDVLMWVSRITNTCARIDDAIYFLGRKHPRLPGSAILDSSRSRWIAYHVAQYYMSVSATLDLALHAANECLRLNVPVKHCGENLLRDHALVPRKFKSLLSEYTKALQKYEAKDRRNKIVHRGEQYELQDILDDGFLLQLAMYESLESHADYDRQAGAVATSRLNLAVRVLRVKLSSESSDLASKFVQLIDSLEPFFAHYASSLASGPDQV